MLSDAATTARVDYLQRCGSLPERPSPPYTLGDPSARRLLWVEGIGKPAKDHRLPVDKREPWRPVTTELITGLYSYRIPIAYALRGSKTGVEICVGTWPTGVSAKSTHDDMQMTVIESVLHGLYPTVDLSPTSTDWQSWSTGGIALGIPSPHGLDDGDGAGPIDRVIRSMSGTDWALLVLAQPASEQGIAREREKILNEMRVVMSAAQHEAAPSPLTEHYVELLKTALAAAGDAMATGGWRTGIYLLGDHDSYPRLASAWRSVMSGAKSLPEPVRTVDVPNVNEAARLWGLPNTPGTPGPGQYHRPFEYQTLLSTTQLASCVHLPELETPGFTVRPAPAFSVSRAAPKAGQASVDIGEIMVQHRPTGLPYRLELDQLTRHAFIAGLTGAGKTNTLIHIISQTANAGVPFLVIEPAKTEYRELLGRRDVGGDVRVFTVGREQVAPLRINPFEVAQGVDVSTHLDLLKAVFTASFALWIPLPQVLEQCLVDLYAERGWDFGSSEHPPGDATGAPAVPRLADLVAAVERTVPGLGYKSESTQEITASLTTRLNALRRGARGMMLDVERSIPMDEILRRPTIIELEGVGDDADKAFMMGLILIRLYEHRRAAHAAALAKAAREGKPPPQPGRLRHIVVVEEAHRLLGSERKQTDAWTADPKGAFVDAFSQMLSEVRAYGQSIVVADQVPVRLAPDVLKNTNLKIGHRLVAGDDREAMAKAMSMSEEQSAQLAVLPPGRAAVFSEGDHTPVIVQVPQAKDRGNGAAIDDNTVARAMKRWRDDPAIGRWFASSVACRGACPDPLACRIATALTDRPDARLLANRLWHTTVEHADGLDVVWPDVRAFVASRAAGIGGSRPAVGGGEQVGIDAQLHSFTIHAMALVSARRSVQGGWASADVASMSELTLEILYERMKTNERWLGATSARLDLIALAGRLQTRRYDPLPLCQSICPDGRCGYLHSLVDVRTAPRHQGVADSGPPPDDQLIDVASELAQDVTGVAADAPGGAEHLIQSRWRATACAAQLLRADSDHPHHQAKLVADVFTAAGWTIEYKE